MALDNIPTLGPGSLNSNLDKVLVYKNGGSEVAVSLLTLTNSALSLSGVYLDTVNGRMGIGTPSPTVALDIYSAFTASAMLKVFNGYTSREACVEFRSQSNQMYFGGAGLFVSTTAAIGTIDSLPARLGIKGSGSTSATTSLLVQNSASTQLLKVADDGVVTVQKMNVTSGYPSYTVNGVNLMDYGSGIRIGYDASVTQITMYTNGGTPQLAINNNGQVSIAAGSANASAQLDVNSTTRGFLKPRLTTAQKNAIATPAAGLEIYDTDLNRPCFYNGTSWITL
jgi:hypothetical protein